MQVVEDSQHLLAIDLGSCFGMALFGRDGRLCWYRSQQFSNMLQLRRFAARLFTSAPNPVTWLITEGDIALAAPFERIAMRQGTRVQRVTQTAWQDYFLDNWQAQRLTHRQLGVQDLAKRIIVWSGLPTPVALPYDAAEAILIGFWGLFALGWLREMPFEMLQTPVWRCLKYRVDAKMT